VSSRGRRAGGLPTGWWSPRLLAWDRGIPAIVPRGNPPLLRSNGSAWPARATREGRTPRSAHGGPVQACRSLAGGSWTSAEGHGVPCVERKAPVGDAALAVRGESRIREAFLYGRRKAGLQETGLRLTDAERPSDRRPVPRPLDPRDADRS
jgi:hypothetical protein